MLCTRKFLKKNQFSVNYVTKNDRLKVVIVGGVAGGASAAARSRRLAENADITLIERGEDISFANCGLPYYIGGEITNRHNLSLHTPQSLSELLSINIMTKTEAIKIDRKAKELLLSNNKTVKYDKLILSTGASPIIPASWKADHLIGESVFTLRNLKDMDNIVSQMKEKKNVVVVGAGYIGLELVEAFVRKGLNVTLVELNDQVLPQVDPEMSYPTFNELNNKGVTVILKDSVKTITKALNGNVIIQFDSGKLLSTDFVVASVGVCPESKLALDCGLNISSKKAIEVNQFMLTNDESIYAIGDVTMTKDIVTGMPAWVPLAGPANRQGRLVADHIFLGDKASPFKGTIGTAIVRFFDVVTASTGWSEKSLKREGIKYKTVSIVGYQHAGYYPGSQHLTVKVNWDENTEQILGAQVVGYDGVDKRIDVLSTAILTKMKVSDLVDLELAYSPPFGSARDILNTVGFVAQNINRGITHPIYDFDTTSDTCLLDVRAREIATMHPIPNALNIPLGCIRDNIDQIRAFANGKILNIICNVGQSSYFAERILSQNGLNTRSLNGGMFLNEMKHNYNAEQSSSEPQQQQQQQQQQHQQQQQQPRATLPPLVIDACGLKCPGPIMALKSQLEKLNPGQELIITSNDPGFYKDFPSFCKLTGQDFVEVNKEKGIITGKLRRPSDNTNQLSSEQVCTQLQNGQAKTENRASIVVFSEDMDKVLAALVIANGMVATGGKATLFFTFWGLSALRKSNNKKDPNHVVNKSVLDKMFSAMLPKDMSHLPLSNFNFGGLGAHMMKFVMQHKSLPSVEGLFASAMENGVEFVACTMSMEAMGIDESELIDNVSLGGVSEFLGRANNSSVTLFI